MMENYGILGWIVIGGLAGAIAKLLMPGKDPGGCIIILLGIAGALLAGFLGKSIGWYRHRRRRGLHRRDRRRVHHPAALPPDLRRRRWTTSASAAVQQTAMARGRPLRDDYPSEENETMRHV